MKICLLYAEWYIIHIEKTHTNFMDQRNKHKKVSQHFYAILAQHSA